VSDDRLWFGINGLAGISEDEELVRETLEYATNEETAEIVLKALRNVGECEIEAGAS